MALDFPTLAFLGFAVTAALAGLATIAARNPVHAALWLVLTFFSVACTWIVGGAEFLGVVLILVYVGAVMVLFLFVVMMLDVDMAPKREGYVRYLPVGLIVALVMLAQILALIGVRAGAWLRDHGSTRLLLTAMVALVLGLAWSQLMPLNKQLWTSSFVIYAAGWSLLLLALCHHVFDLRNAPALGRSMGINAITAYAGSWLLACLLSGSGLLRPLYQRLFASWVTPVFGPHAASLAYAVAFVALWWWLMWGMQRKGIRISI